MDGVLYDTMPLHARSWHLSMEYFGYPMSEQDAYLCEGMRGVDTIEWVVERSDRERGTHTSLTMEDKKRMYKKKSDMFNALPPAPIMPGVLAFMRHINDKGMKIGVVTGSGQLSLLNKLEADFSGLIYRELCVTAFDVTKGKPDKEPYVKGCQKLGISPENGIVIENAPLGVRSAKAAGLFTIAINTGLLSDEVLQKEKPDLLFHNYQEVDSWFKGFAQ